MKEKTKLLLMKALAALCLVLCFFPVFLLLGRSQLPEYPAVWYLLPAGVFLWGSLCYLLPGKGRMAGALLGCVLAGIGGALLLFPIRWQALFLILPCWFILILLPPAWARPVWEEWHPAFWVTGVILYLISQFLATRPQFSGLETPLAAGFCLQAFLLILTLNRHGLRDGMQGAQKAPAALRRRNQALIIAVFIPALLAAFWGPLGKLLDAVWNGIKYCIGQVIWWLMRLFPTTESTSGGMGGGGGGDLMGLPPAEEPSAFAQLMEKVFLVLALLLCAVLVGFALRFLGKWFHKLWKKLMDRLRRYAAAAGEDYTDEAESTLNLDEKAKAIREKIQHILPRTSRLPAWEELDGRARVRRLYQQYLRRKPAARSLTAREALSREKDLPQDQATAFTRFYERARYSDHEVSTQDADQLRRQIK